ncbi:MAG TPA: restriction endonuclease [Anaerolineae bacterium]|nr:restriction endonuclease [Anaerolineae bacterium]
MPYELSRASPLVRCAKMRTEWVSFEELVAQVLRAKGFVAEVTQPTSDGGIDIIAQREEPLLRGKHVVQCKNWSNPVGVGAVRDLYGTVTHERASKGTLITTSSFTQGAIDFARDKPLELIDGEQWKELVTEIGHTGPRRPAATSRAQIVQQILDTFDELSIWARRSMRELDYIAQEEPLISADRNASSKGYKEEYRTAASESVVSFCRAISEASRSAGLLMQVVNRWSALKEKGYSSDLGEELEQLQVNEHHVSTYQRLFEKAYDIYYASRKIPPPPSLTKSHTDALEGMYYGLSAVLTIFIRRPAKQYEGRTVHVELGGSQELVDHYAKNYHELIDAALAGLQSRRGPGWLRRIVGR